MTTDGRTRRFWSARRSVAQRRDPCYDRAAERVVTLMAQRGVDHRDVNRVDLDKHGGRGRYRTADRWCVKPELYH